VGGGIPEVFCVKFRDGILSNQYAITINGTEEVYRVFQEE
jgi:hypothetical protein